MRYDRGGGRRDFQRSFAPVKVGDELEVKIESVGEKGDGVAKKDGFVLFVPGTKQGDEVRIKVTRVLAKVGFAEVVGEKSAKDPEAEQEEQSSEAEQESSEPDEEYKGEDTSNFGEEETEDN